MKAAIGAPVELPPSCLFAVEGRARTPVHDFFVRHPSICDAHHHFGLDLRLRAQNLLKFIPAIAGNSVAIIEKMQIRACCKEHHAPSDTTSRFCQKPANRTEEACPCWRPAVVGPTPLARAVCSPAARTTTSLGGLSPCAELSTGALLADSRRRSQPARFWPFRAP